MKLIYKIHFNSTNGYFKNIIDELIKDFNIKASTEQYKGFIAIFLDDAEENIHSFFKYLEENLPLSLFLSGGEVIDSIDEKMQALPSKPLHQNIAISPSKIVEIYQTSSLYENEAKELKTGTVIRFESSNGLKDLSLATFDNRVALGGDVKLLIINLNALKELLALSDKDIQLLSSVERPLVKLKFNILKNQNKEYSSTNFIYGKLPDDEAGYALATACRKEGIDFLIYKEWANEKDIKVTYNDEQNIIVSGDKTLFPKYDYTLQKEYGSSKEYFDDNGGVFKAVLSQYHKRLSSSIGVYMSMKSYESSIAVNIPSKGITEIIKVPNVFTHFQTCIEDIESIDENTPRLIESYKKRFPEVFENEPELERTHGFETILNLIAHMIGLKDAKEFEDKSYEFGGKSGINVDFKVVKIDGHNYLDYRRVVQSIMSYKMADVNEALLAFSFYESLSEFISENVTSIQEEIQSFDVVLCGDMFAHSNLLSKTTKALTAYNILIPSEYPLDY